MRAREQEEFQALRVISLHFKRCYYLTVFLLGPDVQDRREQQAAVVPHLPGSNDLLTFQ